MQVEAFESPRKERDHIQFLVAGEEELGLPSLEEWLLVGGPRVRLIPGDDHTQLFTRLADLTLVAIDFPEAADGRGFSMGRALREAGFDGELRATGQFMRDQLNYLRRCGFNAFEVPATIDPQGAVASLEEFSIRYQTVQEQQRPIAFRMR